MGETRAAADVEGLRFRDAVAQRTRQLVLVHPHRSPTRSPWPAGREHTAVVLRLARGRLSSTTSRVRTEPGPNVAPLAAMGGAGLREPHGSDEPFWHLWPNPWAGPGIGDPAVPKLG